MKKRVAFVIAAAPLAEMLIRFQPTLNSVDYFPAVALHQKGGTGGANSHSVNSGRGAPRSMLLVA